MNKTKTIILLAAASLVILAAVGVTYAQIVNSQNQNSIYSQNPGQLQATNGPVGYGYYVPSGNGTYAYYPCYPNGAAQITQQAPATQTPYQNSGRMGMGMCGCNW